MAETVEINSAIVHIKTTYTSKLLWIEVKIYYTVTPVYKGHWREPVYKGHWREPVYKGHWREPVYKGHWLEPANVPFMGSLPLYTG